MAIQQHDPIIYSEVVSNVITFLKSICYNIDEFKKDGQGR